MSRLVWYWHRLGAMAPAEMVQRVRKKGVQFIDAHKERDWTSVAIPSGARYPALPDPKLAPDPLRQTLGRDAADILHGKWRAFGHLPIQVDDPPEWHKDHLAGVNLRTEASAFELDHRALPNGADIKLIWELSRWHSLTRLAIAAFVLGDGKAARKCIHWLEHWAQHNPPYRGWNWTSALESGMRLIQFTWIDALLRASTANGEYETELEKLRYDILPAHTWFTWRHKSFGSSANNHLLGELAGLILATVRWPEVAAWGASLDESQEIWEGEVLTQFAGDGGNREQALHYHLFSLELCWHVRNALHAAGRALSPNVDERLARAMEFFAAVQGKREPWDYGDSDDATALPLCVDETRSAIEWDEWMTGEQAALAFWIGAAPCAQAQSTANGWRVWKDSGIATARCGKAFLRLDASPLGYLSTAAHGHCDALHLSLWVDDIAIVIDPGTGAYYSDKDLRAWLASYSAHNGPLPTGIPGPKRLGPFLWTDHHDSPRILAAELDVTGELTLATCVLRRTVSVTQANQITVRDSVETASEFSVLWQLAPEAKCERVEARRFRIVRHERALEVRISDDWDIVDFVATKPSRATGEFEGLVSPRFRVTTWAPYLKLTAKPVSKPCLFTTTFLAL